MPRVFKKGTYDRYFRNKMRTRRGRYARKRRATFKTRVQRVLMKKTETKKYQFCDENVQLYHNIGASSTLPPVMTLASLVNFYNVWADIERGTKRCDRIGDKITPRGMSLKIYLANKFDRPNTMYRIIIARVPKTVGGVATTYTSITNPFDDPQLGSTGNKMLLPLDKDRGIKALYDKIHRVGQQATGPGYPEYNSGTVREGTKIVKLWLRSKKAREIQYDSSAQIIVNNPIVMWIIPYEQYSTLITDRVGSCSYYGTIYYKDV